MMAGKYFTYDETLQRDDFIFSLLIAQILLLIWISWSVCDQ